MRTSLSLSLSLSLVLFLSFLSFLPSRPPPFSSRRSFPFFLSLSSPADADALASSKMTGERDRSNSRGPSGLPRAEHRSRHNFDKPRSEPFPVSDAYSGTRAWQARRRGGEARGERREFLSRRREGARRSGSDNPAGINKAAEREGNIVRRRRRAALCKCVIHNVAFCAGVPVIGLCRLNMLANAENPNESEPLVGEQGGKVCLR